MNSMDSTINSDVLSVLWCPQRFPHENEVRSIITSSCLYWGLMSYSRYMCLFVHSCVQSILCCVFALFVFVWCTICCRFLWIVHSWLSLRVAGFSGLSIFDCPFRYSLAFVYKRQELLTIRDHLFLPTGLTTWFDHLVWPPVLTTCFDHLVWPPDLTTWFDHLVWPPVLTPCFDDLVWPPVLTIAGIRVAHTFSFLCVFCFCLPSSCDQCCQCLRIVHSWLSLPFSIAFIFCILIINEKQ